MNRHTAGPAVAQVWRRVIFDGNNASVAMLFHHRNFIESTGTRRGIGFRVMANTSTFRFSCKAFAATLLVKRFRFTAVNTRLAAGTGDVAVFQTGRAISIAEGEGVLEEVHIVALGTAFIRTLMRAAELFTRQRRKCAIHSATFEDRLTQFDEGIPSRSVLNTLEVSELRTR